MSELPKVLLPVKMSLFWFKRNMFDAYRMRWLMSSAFSAGMAPYDRLRHVFVIGQPGPTTYQFLPHETRLQHLLESGMDVFWTSHDGRRYFYRNIPAIRAHTPVPRREDKVDLELTVSELVNLRVVSLIEKLTRLEHEPAN
jgi:hypothetical protein